MDDTTNSDQIESTPSVVEVPPQDEHQPLVRDMELIRALLLYIAQNAREHQSIPQPNVEGRSAELVSYHLAIMHEAGLVKGARNMDRRWGLGPLTWEGKTS